MCGTVVWCRSLQRLCMTTFFVLIHTVLISAAFGFGSGKDRVRLEDISVLTLHHGKMTNARRSSAVPQLKCIGGSAGCSAFTPQTVQCYNRGSDGYDVQWECKTDMDNAYRFGQIEVTCEGYDSSDDDYVLRGSCGLEYTLDLTKEGMQQNKHGQHHSYYGNSDDYYGTSNKHSHHKSSGIDWVVLAMVGVVIYILYRTCLADSSHSTSTTSDGSDDGYPGPRGSGFGPGGGGGPPPPGFRTDQYPSGGCGASQGYGASSPTGGAGLGGGTGGGGAGFWTGAAAGGLLGYLFGGGRNRGYGYGGYGGYNRPHYGYSRPRTGFSSGWGGGGGGGFSGFSGGGSTGTRTASGFGGTRRR